MAIFKPLFPSVLQRKIYCSAEENLLLRREKLFPPQRKKVSSAEKRYSLRGEDYFSTIKCHPTRKN